MEGWGCLDVENGMLLYDQRGFGLQDGEAILFISFQQRLVFLHS